MACVVRLSHPTASCSLEKWKMSLVKVTQMVTSWSRAALCGMPVGVPPWKPWLLWHWGYTGEASWLCYMRLCYGCCYGCCISHERGCIMAAMPARREWKCLQFLQLLESPSSLLAHTLPTLGSADSVDSTSQLVSWTGSAIHPLRVFSLCHHSRRLLLLLG